MSAIDNGFGEMMPDEVRIRLHYRSDTRWLTHCDAPSEVIPAGSSWTAHPVTWYTEATFQSACVARGTHDGSQFNTLSPGEMTFLYMDVGMWGGRFVAENQRRRPEDHYLAAVRAQHREFGVACGCHAVLCRWDNTGGRSLQPQGSDDSARLIHRVLQSLCTSSSSVEIRKWESVQSSVQPRIGPPVYVFLGDLHLPIVKDMPRLREERIQETQYRPIGGGGVAPRQVTRSEYHLMDPPEPRMGRVVNGDYDPLDTQNGNKLHDWYESYRNGDIFRGGEHDLLEFLTLLEHSPERQHIHFVQVGDLYDLWIGLAPYFEEVSSDPPGHVRLSRRERGREAREFVDYWVTRANACYPELTNKLSNLNVGRKTFLYGNHDNYLARYVPSGSGIGPLTPRIRYIRTQDMYSGERTLSREVPFGIAHGIYVEHGQWVDSSNFDGCRSGHSFTDSVFAHPDLRSADPQRRHYYTTGAAIEYMCTRNFGIFVMGHTHMPYLTRVRVERVLDAPPAPPRQRLGRYGE